MPVPHRPSSRLLLIAGVVGIALLGNLRSQASERTMPICRSSAVIEQPASSAPERGVGVTSAALGMKGDGDDEGKLVPAIYALDPDVRYVFFRHVSKWT